MILGDDRGQTTVGLVIVMPVAIVLAAIALNALLFFSECARFDRIANNAVRVCAAAPAYGQGLDQSVARIDAIIEDAMGPGVSCDVSVEGGGAGFSTFTMRMAYEPSFLGIDLKDQLFGVSLPALVHQTSLVVDSYKPGVLL